MGRRRVTVDELLARAEANGYKREEHKEKTRFGTVINIWAKIKKDQNAALNRYVLWKAISLSVKNELDADTEPLIKSR
jgi:hypothetical protein